MEKYIRKAIDYDKEDISFQVLEFIEKDEEVVNEDNFSDDEMDYEDNQEKYKAYTIRAFGVTENGESVCLKIDGFTPFFYIKVPDYWKKSDADAFIKKLISTKGYYYGKPYNPLHKFAKHLIREKTILQLKKDFYGFTGSCKSKFLRLTFDNLEAMRKFIYLINNHNDPLNKTDIGCKFDIKLYETNINPILHFIHIRNLIPSGWIVAKNIKSNSLFKRESRCQFEISTHWTNIEPINDKEGNSRILQASFDIEVYSIDGTFPLPTVKENVVTQIATAFKYQGDPDFLIKHIICLKECAPIDDDSVVVEWYNTEKEVLLAFRKLINKMDPDIIYTYNGDIFDCNYLNERAKICGCSEVFLDLSKLKTDPAILNDRNFSSSAYGNTNYKRLEIPGRINFDILIYIQREYKENSYKLDSISEKYLNKNKNEMKVQDMFDFFEKGNPEDIRTLALYCIQDTLLPQLLVDKLSIFQNQISMSNIAYVPFKYLVERGQSIKVYSQILKETKRQGYLIPCLSKTVSGTFQGATVLPPIDGAYFEPVTVCDFASLYPSIIRAHNLCYNTIVLDEKYQNLPGVEYTTLEWEDSIKGETFFVKFAKSTDGIIPGILKDLTDKRKKYKLLMAKEKDPFKKEIYNKCQLAVKVSMNSFYGFFASPMLPCKKIAGTITAFGRNMIADTKKFMEDNYPGSKIIAGDTDSVFVKFKTNSTELLKKERDRIYNHVVITNKDKEYLKTIEEKCIAESIEIGKLAANAATEKLFLNPIKLEYEKVYYPLLMLSKKRYIGNLYSETPSKFDYRDNKGIVLKRRDNFELLKIVYKRIIDIFMEDGDKGLPKVLDYLNNLFDDILCDKIDKNTLVCVKTLKGPYKNNNLPHVVLAKKISERDPGRTPRSNDRIPYIFIDTDWVKLTPQYMKVEEPQVVIDENLPIDKEYYIKYFMNPICEILVLFMNSPENLFKDILKKYKKQRLEKIKKRKIN